MAKPSKLPPIEMVKDPLRLKVQYPDGTFHLREVKTPPVAAYHTLVMEFVDLTNRLRNGEDPLAMSVEALRGFVEYMQADTSTFVAGACQPIVNILGAAHDTLRGGKQNMLHERPKKVGRPSDLERHRGRACLVLALDALIDSGFAEVDGEKILIAETDREGMANAETGNPYHAGELIQLRSKVRDSTAPKVLLDLYKQAKEQAEAVGMLAAAATSEGARRFARVMVISIAKSQPT